MESFLYRLYRWLVPLRVRRQTYLRIVKSYLTEDELTRYNGLVMGSDLTDNHTEMNRLLSYGMTRFYTTGLWSPISYTERLALVEDLGMEDR